MSSLTEPFRPVTAPDRIVELDVLRGFAVLGILLINILGMGLPLSAGENPTVYGGNSGLDHAAWYGINVFFIGSMRAIFSMLFGAGFILFLDRLEARGVGTSIVGVFSRRALLLIGFGLFDFYILLWSGDILWIYGLAAFLLLPFWKARLSVLAAASFALLAVLAFWGSVIEERVAAQFDAHEAAVSLQLEGKELSPGEIAAIDAWQNRASSWQPSDADIQQALAATSQRFGQHAAENSQFMFGLTLGRFLRIFLLDALLGMLVGMIAYRSGLLTGQWSTSSLLALTAVALLAGATLRILETNALITSDYSYLQYLAGLKTQQTGRLLMAFFWIGAVLTILRTTRMSWFNTPMKAVGRLALSNYLLQSLMAVLLFLGFGYFGMFSRAELYVVVLAMWAVSIVFSLAWLHVFTMGPAECLWRAGVYGHWPSIRRR